MTDLINRQAAIEALRKMQTYKMFSGDDMLLIDQAGAMTELMLLPPAQPEPAIPLSWIEGQIEWLKSLDNAFSTLTAGQILAMMNKWKDEQKE